MRCWLALPGITTGWALGSMPGLAGIEPMPSGARLGRGTAFDLLLLPPRSVRADSLCVDFCTHTEMMEKTHQFCGFGVSIHVSMALSVR